VDSLISKHDQHRHKVVDPVEKQIIVCWIGVRNRSYRRMKSHLKAARQVRAQMREYLAPGLASYNTRPAGILHVHKQLYYSRLIVKIQEHFVEEAFYLLRHTLRAQFRARSRVTGHRRELDRLA